MVNTLLSVNPDPSSTTSIFQRPAGARNTSADTVPSLPTAGIVIGPYLIFGCASRSVANACDVVENGVRPVARMLNGTVTFASLRRATPEHPGSS